MTSLGGQLQNLSAVREKIALLNADPNVSAFFSGISSLSEFLSGLSPELEVVMKQLIAIGQWDRLVGNIVSQGQLRELLENLVEVDFFYRELGGILGYHEKILSLLQDGQNTTDESSVSLHSPSFIDISDPSSLTSEAISWGIDAVPEMAEIYPLGGAADRLHLIDEMTGAELPAAKLVFAGRTLFEGLIRDLFAREFLHFQRVGKQVVTPVAIMTSLEKGNHRHVLQIAEEHRWFGRPKEMFRLFTQPLVPVVDKRGQWCLSAPNKPLLKPGGHGALWKRARDEGIFSWLEHLGRKKALIRQINNPAAGLDYGLLAFTGIGWKNGMKFGFASCPRLISAAEGINVLIERKLKEKRTLVLTNIEYCDFVKAGIEDRPRREGDPHSRFSSNTNILFADLEAVSRAVDQCPFPGLLINLKTGVATDPSGATREEPMARLESTMQNIADVFVEEVRESLNPQNLTVMTKETFITYNHRRKTISTAKRAYAPGKPLQETPEHCFFELLLSARELLEKECHFQLPPQRGLEEYLERGPAFSFLYHPALGPLYSMIGQKLRGGQIALGSELELEISDIALSGLKLEGSLRILADQVMGHFDSQGHLHFSDKRGRCVLEDVSVRNLGVDWGRSRPFWKGRFSRRESLEIVLRGHSEFAAIGVAFEGPCRFEVEDGTRLVVEQRGDRQICRKERLE